MRLRGTSFAVMLAAAAGLGLAGCGDDGESGDLASLVPPDVPLYAEAVVRPDGDQADAIESLSERVAGIQDPGQRLIDEVNRSFAEDDITYEDDIEPWLGDHAALFVRSFEGAEPDMAVLIEATDAAAAQAFIDENAEANPDEAGEERTYEGTDYLTSSDGAVVGLVGDTLVFGTEDSFKVVVDASDGESLGASEEFTQRSEPLDDDALATVYVELGAALDAAINAGEVDLEDAKALRPLLGSTFTDPVAIGVTADDDSATVDTVATVGETHPAVGDPALLEGLPSGSWLAFGFNDLGPTLDRWLDEVANSGVPGGATFEREVEAESGINLRRDLTGWLGDVAAFAKGSGAPGTSFGLVAETKDPQGPRKLVETVQELAEADSGLRSAAPPEGADYGFSLGVPGIGAGADVGVAGDRLVAALGSSFQQVLSPGETLATDPDFQGARERLGDDFVANLYFDIQQGFALAESGDPTDPDYDEARPYVEKLGALIAGASVQDDLLVSRLIVTLAQ